MFGYARVCLCKRLLSFVFELNGRCSIVFVRWILGSSSASIAITRNCFTSTPGHSQLYVKESELSAIKSTFLGFIQSFQMGKI